MQSQHASTLKVRSYRHKMLLVDSKTSNGSGTGRRPSVKGSPRRVPRRTRTKPTRGRRFGCHHCRSPVSRGTRNPRGARRRRRCVTKQRRSARVTCMVHSRARVCGRRPSATPLRDDSRRIADQRTNPGRFGFKGDAATGLPRSVGRSDDLSSPRGMRAGEPRNRRLRCERRRAPRCPDGHNGGLVRRNAAGYVAIHESPPSGVHLDEGQTPHHRVEDLCVVRRDVQSETHLGSRERSSGTPKRRFDRGFERTHGGVFWLHTLPSWEVTQTGSITGMVQAGLRGERCRCIGSQLMG